ncbi:MAG: GTP-binding protein [candidate division WWE3 bacterium]|nr:GTP-binding protein [candidate division WWE3 bacterium]
MENIRNFALIAHIDHGKSTLADRLMEKAGLLPSIAHSSDRPATPRIDRMELETERGVTIKLKAVRMEYTGDKGSRGDKGQHGLASAAPDTPVPPDAPVTLVDPRPFVLNMIDTPGHADFSYEVSRSLAACEGVLLLVDATQGVQAQTLSHLEKARELGLAVIGVVNKVDSPLARVEETEKEMRQLGVEGKILRISALEGIGIDEVLAAIIERIPAPRGELAEPFRALVFDSIFDAHLGVLAYVRVVDGKLETGNHRFQRGPAKGGGLKHEKKVRFLKVEREAGVKEIGYLNPDRSPAESLIAGEVGYLATGLRDPKAVRVGDTVSLINQLTNQPVNPLPGYKPPQSFVFASFFAENAEFEEFQKALQTLRLEEPAISVEEISSTAFGRGFRIGFLGTFHLEIVKERLEREFGLELVVTKPTVAFRGLKEEPWIILTILTPSEYLSGVARLAAERRGRLGETETLGNRLKIAIELPLLEFVRGFYNALKSISRGYASLSWEFSGYRPAELAELEILVHGEPVEGLAETVRREGAERIGREKIKKLKEILPRQQFAYAVQAKVGGKIIAREDISAVSKDVLAKLSGGHVERKMKKLQEQKKGKKKLAKFGKVEVPPEAFLV